jgi:hypothetical protein
MASYSRLMLQGAATAGIAAVLSMATPAVAADQRVCEAPAAYLKTVAAIERRASAATAIAASRHVRRANPIRYSQYCSGIWCGRQFVLMVGIAY